MLLDVFPTGPIQANCTLLGDEDAGVMVIVDPGDEAERIIEKVRESGLAPVAILHTHGHLDHAGGTGGVKAAFPEAPIRIHRDDLELYQNLARQGRMFGLEMEDPPPPDGWLEHGERIAVGHLELEVRHTPGHSPGSVCFVVHHAPEPLVIAGDVLFAGSIGRTDLWGGSFEVLERSILDQLYTLPDETRVITGHGPVTTIGHERHTNPFVRSE
ncbi:MAG TPA: MBL fold metallo-hydrolase [Acidobacteria bacterium]|nr:MBL fold metallo-hydrolase [Acidobacteriota bacterium]